MCVYVRVCESLWFKAHTANTGEEGLGVELPEHDVLEEGWRAVSLVGKWRDSGPHSRTEHNVLRADIRGTGHNCRSLVLHTVELDFLRQGVVGEQVKPPEPTAVVMATVSIPAKAGARLDGTVTSP